MPKTIAVELWQCATCGGTYADPQPTGARYFHACPPLATREITRAALTPADQVQYDLIVSVSPLPKPGDPPADTVHPLDAFLSGLTIERANHRDENVVMEEPAGGKPGRAVAKADYPGGRIPVIRESIRGGA